MRALRWIVVALVVVFLLAPLLVIAVGSVNENRYLNFPPEGFSLSWYGQLFTDTGWRTSIRYSVTIAATSAALAVLIATPLAYVLRSYRIRLAPLLYTLGILPFMLPPIISALGMQVFWLSTGHVGRIENVIVAHAVFFSTLPLVTIWFTVETLPVKIANGLRYGFTPTIAAVAVVFILIAATTFTLFAIFGNLMKFLGADPAILEKNRG